MEDEVDLIGGRVSRHLWGNSRVGDENENDPCGERGHSLLQRPLGVGGSDKERCRTYHSAPEGSRAWAGAGRTGLV